MATSEKKLSRTLRNLSILFIVITIFSLPEKSWCLNGADIAIYNDTAYSSGGAWLEGLNAIKAMLDYYGYTHEDITPDDINTNSNLNSLYRVIIFGGGWAGGYNTYVNTTGFNNIRNFVVNGGGYFGICAGSYFASDIVIWKQDWETPIGKYDYPLSLFSGVGMGPLLSIIAWTSPTGCFSGITEGAAMTTVRVDNSIMPNVNTEMRILYYGGPMFKPFRNSTMTATVVATYQTPGAPADGSPAMILFNYGNGKVFLTGPHPEVSFDNCTLWYDNATWELMDSAFSLLMNK